MAAVAADVDVLIEEAMEVEEEEEEEDATSTTTEVATEVNESIEVIGLNEVTGPNVVTKVMIEAVTNEVEDMSGVMPALVPDEGTRISEADPGGIQTASQRLKNFANLIQVIFLILLLLLSFLILSSMKVLSCLGRIIDLYVKPCEHQS